jgi:hypothetical protein
MTTITIQEVAAAAQAIYDDQGFLSKTSHEVILNEKTSNGRLLFEHFAVQPKVTVTDEHRQAANEILQFLEELPLKAIERDLSGYEKEALRVVRKGELSVEDDRKDLFLIASFPTVCNSMHQQHLWGIREADCARKSEYVGELHKRCGFELTAEFIRKLSNGSYLYCCTDSDNNLVKFFYDHKQIGKVGDKLKVKGYVKSHSLGKYSGGKETMLNRVRIEVL